MDTVVRLTKVWVSLQQIHPTPITVKCWAIHIPVRLIIYLLPYNISEQGLGCRVSGDTEVRYDWISYDMINSLQASSRNKGKGWKCGPGRLEYKVL